MSRKTRKAIMLSVMATVAMCILLIVFCPSKFSVSDYSEEIDRYVMWHQSGDYEDLCVDPINSKPEALIEAVKLFENRYTLDEFSYTVAYDRSCDCWMVRGRVFLHQLSAGGIDNVIINSDGKVIAIWIEM